MDLNDEMLDMMKFYEFYKKMRAYENKNELPKKFKKSTQKQREQMKFLKKFFKKQMEQF